MNIHKFDLLMILLWLALAIRLAFVGAWGMASLAVAFALAFSSLTMRARKQKCVRIAKRAHVEKNGEGEGKC